MKLTLLLCSICFFTVITEVVSEDDDLYATSFRRILKHRDTKSRLRSRYLNNKNRILNVDPIQPKKFRYNKEESPLASAEEMGEVVTVLNKNKKKSREGFLKKKLRSLGSVFKKKLKFLRKSKEDSGSKTKKMCGGHEGGLLKAIGRVITFPIRVVNAGMHGLQAMVNSIMQNKNKDDKVNIVIINQIDNKNQNTNTNTNKNDIPVNIENNQVVLPDGQVIPVQNVNGIQGGLRRRSQNTVLPKHYKEEIAAGDLADLTTTNHGFVPNKYSYNDLGRRYVLQSFFRSDSKTEESEIVDYVLEAQLGQILEDLNQRDRKETAKVHK